jgi:hypothetical protein
VTNPYLERRRRAGKGVGNKSETRTSKRLGAKQVVLSGSLPGSKGDMRVSDCLVEAKCTMRNSLSVDLGWLRKIAQEARQVGRTPALAITFVRGDGVPVVDGTWVAVPEDVFKYMLTKASQE